MKAVKIRKFGSPDALTLVDLPMPSPAAGEVLVKIHAASINAADIDWMKGLFFVRFMGSARRRVLGPDMAGTVAAVGGDVARWKPGDRVMADLYSIGRGTFCEYVCVPEGDLRPVPDGVTLRQAAAIPQAGVCALQGMRMGNLREGMSVLINGAGGGMGSFAMQLARNLGAEVTAVDRADKFALMTQLGAARCLDYQTQEYTKLQDVYDFILDMNAKHKMSAYRAVLKPEGVFAVVGGKPKTILAAHMAGSRKSTGGQKFGLLLWKPNNADDIAELRDDCIRRRNTCN